MEYIKVKEAETIELSCMYMDDIGLARDITDIVIESSAQSLGSKQEYPFTVTVINALTGEFLLSLPSNTLPERKYLVDILFKDASTLRRVASDTFQLQVERSITKGTI